MAGTAEGLRRHCARPSHQGTDRRDIRVTSTNICGSDLHRYEVLGAFMSLGDILGHEAMRPRLILTALLAGLRADELVRANVGDLRRTDGGAVIHVRGKGVKDRRTRSSRRWSTSSSAISKPGPAASPPRPNGAPPLAGA